MVCFNRWRRRKVEITAGEFQAQENNEIEVATNSFSFHNKIGEGGFGLVYELFFPTTSLH